ncbi:MAG: hypothetical protein OEW19_09060, partial [Acidobacteriota bacterium]|nr:hypothetical protein [Acidobacteriota bacterium]
ERYSFGGQGFEARGTRRFAGGGPRFAARGRRVTGFAQLLVGAEDTFGKSLLAIQAGGGADFWIARRLGVRLGLDGRTHWYEDEQEGSWRLQVGGVVAVGSR